MEYGRRRLEGKVAIVTGGSAGIGEAICKLFAREGASVIVAGLPNDPVGEVCHEIGEMGGHSMPFQGDIGLEEAARECVRFAKEQFGKVDILINNAGVFPEQAELQESDTDAFWKTVHGNIASTYFMSKAALPELHETKGCIVNACSEAAFVGEPQISVYSGSKGWIRAFTQSLGNEQVKYSVRVNAVAPGPIDTEMTRPEYGVMDKKFAEMAKSGTPMGRRGTVEEVANVYLFLASDDASYVTSSIYPVDGGAHVSKGALGMFASKDMKEEPDTSLPLEHTMEGRASVK